MTDPIVVISGDSFKRAFDTVQHAVAKIPDRPILTSVLLEVEDAGARLVAADSYRAAIADLDVLAGDDQRIRLPIPHADLLVARKAMPKDLEAVTFALDGHHHVLVEWKDTTFRLPVMDGTYPRVSSIFHDAPPAVALFAPYLGDLRHHGKDRMARVLTVRVAGPERPVIFEMDGSREAIMPVRGVVPTAALEAVLALAETHD